METNFLALTVIHEMSSAQKAINACLYI